MISRPRVINWIFSVILKIVAPLYRLQDISFLWGVPAVRHPCTHFPQIYPLVLYKSFPVPKIDMHDIQKYQMAVLYFIMEMIL